MADGTQNSQIEIPFWDGINSIVQPNVAKRTELYHAENARAPLIGVIEKREGQSKFGTDTNGDVFFTTANYGLAQLPVTDGNYKGIFRISIPWTPSNTKLISVFDTTWVTDGWGAPSNLLIAVFDIITASDSQIFGRTDGTTFILDGTTLDGGATIYSLDILNKWKSLGATNAQNLIGSKFNSTYVNGSLVLVNGRDYNRMISSDGTTITDSTQAGSLFNSPRAYKTIFYKNRIYLANYTVNGVRYPTSVIRSSFPLGIVALANGDSPNPPTTTIEVTDTKYFYTDSGMNTYDVYRGNTKVTTLTVTGINTTSIVATGPTGLAVSLLSSDEIWVAGTYSGTKQRRWVNNPTSFGKDVKQYESFFLSGGDESEITLFETVGNILLAANKNTIISWNDYVLQSMDLGVGCVSPNGYAKLLGIIYFLHYSGVYTTMGQSPQLISRKVEKYIKGATKDGLENAAVGTKGLSVFFAIGNVTLYNDDGSLWKTLKDVCLEFKVADQNWYVHTNVPVEKFQTFLETNGTERLLFLHGKGKAVKEFLDTNAFTDDGDNIFFRADTQPLQLSSLFELYGTPVKLITRLDRGSSARAMISLDEEPFYEIEGMMNKGVTMLPINNKPNVVTPPICRRVKVSLRDSSKQRCRLSNFRLEYTPTTISQPK